MVTFSRYSIGMCWLIVLHFYPNISLLRTLDFWRIIPMSLGLDVKTGANHLPIHRPQHRLFLISWELAGCLQDSRPAVGHTLPSLGNPPPQPHHCPSYLLRFPHIPSASPYSPHARKIPSHLGERSLSQNRGRIIHFKHGILSIKGFVIEFIFIKDPFSVFKIWFDVPRCS